MPKRPKKTLAKLALCTLVLSTPAAAQSLGDAARKERDRRDRIERTRAPSRTLTDEDLASNKGTLANSTETAPAPPEDGEDGEASVGEAFPVPTSLRLPEGPQTANGEEYWRGRVAQARGRIAEARMRHESLQRQIRFGQPELHDRNGQRVIYSIHQMKQRADAAEAELRSAEAALEDLFVEARRAGALPGWLR
jgi:hypothetical protein